MPVPDSRDPRPAYEQVAADLRAAIKEGRLQPGDRLPTEREHASRYGVAVGTYRHALAILRNEGWLTTHKRHGTVVLQPNETPSPEYAALSQRLEQIEIQIAQLVPQLGGIGEIPELDNAAPAIRRQDQADREIPTPERIANLEKRVDELETQVMDLRAANGLEQVDSEPAAEAR